MKFELCRKFAAALVCVGCAGSAASAASLEAIAGTVLVNKGQGFRPVTGRTEIGGGDAVMANAGGSAEIVYQDGCRSRVEPGRVVAVASTPRNGSLKDAPVELSPCSGGPAAQSGTIGTSATAADPGLAALGAVDPNLLIGAGVVGGAVAAAIALSGPSSP
jgi:hypothetical protein